MPDAQQINLLTPTCGEGKHRIYCRAPSKEKRKMVKNPPVNVGDVRDTESIPGSRRSPGGGHGNLF